MSKNFFYGLGRLLGRLAYVVLPLRRRIAKINLARCFPDLSPPELNRLLKQTFESLGIGVLETHLAWFGNKDRILKQCNIQGLNHIEEALKAGRGVLIVGPHTMLFELGGRVLSEHFPLAAVYRKQNQNFFNNFIEQARKRHYLDLIQKTNVRKLLRYLSQNKIVAYLADQAPPKKRRVYVPWFGIPVATHTALSHIARLSGATVLPAMMYRPSKGQYTLTIHPPLTNFGKESEEQDAICLNEFMERSIRAYPEQYFWVHRCLKKQQDEKTNYYLHSSLKPRVINVAYYKRLLGFFKAQTKENTPLRRTKGGGYTLKTFETLQEARRFIEKTNRLRELGIDAVDVVRFYRVISNKGDPFNKRLVVIYRNAPGCAVSELEHSKSWNESLQHRLKEFIERLQRKGISSSLLGSENIVLQSNGLFALKLV